MYSYVPFHEINKNKWNGTVHYSPNGNIFGYYWYLKAVYKSWDAIVEGDYVSVMPILPKSNPKFSLLTPELGPYSVNPLNIERSNSLISLMKSKTLNSHYPLNESTPNLEDLKTNQDIEYQQQELHLIDNYDILKKHYQQNIVDELDLLNSDNISFVSSIKPEVILSLSDKYSKPEKDALIRVMYNAIHRGLGWSQGITDGKTGDFLTLSFYVISHNVIHEIFYLDKAPLRYRMLSYDVFLRNGAGKPTLFKTYCSDSCSSKLGFTNKAKSIYKIINTDNHWWKNIFN